MLQCQRQGVRSEFARCRQNDTLFLLLMLLVALVVLYRTSYPNEQENRAL
jgi:hypothetical protein